MFLIKKISLFVVFFFFLLSLIVDNDDFKLTLLKNKHEQQRENKRSAGASIFKTEDKFHLLFSVFFFSIMVVNCD